MSSTARLLAALPALVLTSGGCLVPVQPYEPLLWSAAPRATSASLAATAEPQVGAPPAAAPTVSAAENELRVALEELRTELEGTREREAAAAEELRELQELVATLRAEIAELEHRNEVLETASVAERTRHLESEKVWLESRITALEASLGEDGR